MGLKVSADLYEATFGDLYDFVDLARGAGITRDAKVTQMPIENHEYSIDHFEVELPSGNVRKAVDLASIDRDHLADVLEAIISTDGDARAALSELKELRDRLL
ncbi:hypothetical protein ACFU44_11975 [Nocardia rhizosphaerihabitans]|uniref:hypothetical protein n=1 Tax=Nocardia rhizosphaerihabitans TaxID=1691570 RepID=UPI0036734A4A